MAPRVHSGGERSIATIMYLLALQKLTPCPFRVVDEVNQGMDATNERRALNAIIKSCSDASTSQFFFITPKLLVDLEYTHDVTALIVFNGAHMCRQVGGCVCFRLPVPVCSTRWWWRHSTTVC